MVKEKIKHFTTEVILPYVFKTSDEPLLLMQLLEANKLHSEGMSVDGHILGYRLRMARAYLVYILLWHLIIIPGAIIFHTLLAKVDSHVSILLAILFTGVFFATFTIFKEWLVDRISDKLIKQAWSNHFPHFNYALHSKELARLYCKAMRQGVQTKDMPRFILENMSKS